MTENKGNLISREALKEDLTRFFPTEILEGIEPKTLFAQIMQDIDNTPTVDAYSKGFYDGRACAESASGIWKYKEYYYYCSNCGNEALELNDYPYLSAYCPFCGAEMRGKEE